MIETYRSAKAKLEFQLSNAASVLDDLEKRYAKLEIRERKKATRAPKPVTAKRPGRPAKAAGKRRGRPPKVASDTDSSSGVQLAGDTGGYRLSKWDEMLLAGLRNSGRVMRKQDLDSWFASQKDADLPADQVYTKVSRVIHKLANKRGVVRKVNVEGRGFAYGLAEWFTPTGRVKAAHQLPVQPRTEETPKRKPGRPKGSKNKPKATATKRKPGRPKGSKNKPKATAAKRKPGRPKGSKNKPRAAATKRKPGRPKGSKNKSGATGAKRRPGRPKGSKNKPKTTSA